MSLARLLEPNWDWIKTPIEERWLVSTQSLLAFSIGYIICMAILQQLIKLRGKPFGDLRIFTGPHNFFMTVYSFYALVGTVSILFENWAKTGFNFRVPFCDPSLSLKPGMDWWLYSFYLSKFLEYIDSLFLVLKGKQIAPPDSSQMFLHVFHHSTTASIVWTTWLFPLSVFWIGPLTNAFVHTIMYGYYFLVEFNLINRNFGGKYITPIQLIQFVICMFGVTYETINYKECGSDIRVVAWVYGTYLIFFVLFVKVWLDKRNERKAPRPKAQ